MSGAIVKAAATRTQLTQTGPVAPKDVLNVAPAMIGAAGIPRTTQNPGDQ